GLGVGLGGERVTRLRQSVAQLAVVLDDAVEHDRYLRGIVSREWVRVLERDPAVRRPARMTQTGDRGRTTLTGFALQVLQVPDRAPVLQSAFLEQGDARRVIASILEALEAVEQELLALSRT